MMQIGMKLGFPWINQNTKCPNKFYNFADGTNVLSPSINFSRTTNATVTNSAGLITYAPMNLLTYSEQFDNAAWTKSTATISANSTIAPNGYQTADTLIANNGTTGSAIQAPTLTSGVTYSYSIYAKYNGETTLRLQCNNGAAFAFADLNTQTGVISSASGTLTNLSSSVTSVGNGWYRGVLTFTAANTAGSNIYAQIIVAGNGVKGVYIWGAQLEISSTATTYNSTTVKNLLGYSELFDNAAWTKSNSFVQTNLLTYSEAFDNAAYTKDGVTISANTVIAPNGYQTADTVTGTTGNFRFWQLATILNGSAYTMSVYAKQGTSPTIAFGFINVSLSTPVFTFATETWSTPANWTTSYQKLDNGWYRLIATYTSNTTFAGPSIIVSGATTAYIWGLQLVQGAVAGDYRRTDAASLPIYYPNQNGVVCAEQLHGTATNGTILESYTATGSSMTFSLWMRRITGTGNVDVTMDTGVTWTTQAITTAWARYSITTTPTAGARTAGIRVVTSGDVIQVFGAMVSDSASLDPYVLNAAAAPTAAAYYGARFDYDPVTLAPKGLLIEEQRTNTLLNSKLDGTALSTQAVTVGAVPWTLSFYGTGTVAITGTYTGNLVGTGAYPTRSTLTFTPTAGVVLLTVTGTVQFAQLEAGAFATSYIPTAASQVTRAADIATIQGSNFYSWYNQNEGTLFLNAKTSPASAIYAVLNSTVFTTNSTYIDNSSGNYRGVNFYNTTATAVITGGSAGAVGVDKKVAFGYAQDNFAESVAGATAVVDTSGVVSSGILKLDIGSASGTFPINTTIKQISYYPTRLPDATLKGLTS